MFIRKYRIIRRGSTTSKMRELVVSKNNNNEIIMLKIIRKWWRKMRSFLCIWSTGSVFWRTSSPKQSYLTLPEVHSICDNSWDLIESGASLIPVPWMRKSRCASIACKALCKRSWRRRGVSTEYSNSPRLLPRKYAALIPLPAWITYIWNCSGFLCALRTF